MPGLALKYRDSCIPYIKIFFGDARPSKRMHPKSENFHMGCISQATLTTRALTIAFSVISANDCSGKVINSFEPIEDFDNIRVEIERLI